MTFPNIGNLKLYNARQRVDMTTLRKHYNDLHINTVHRATYEYVYPNRFIPIKREIFQEMHPYAPDDDIAFLRALEFFQEYSNTPSSTEIHIEAKRTVFHTFIPSNEVHLFPYHQEWKPVMSKKVGIMVISQTNLLGGYYEFHDNESRHDIRYEMTPGQISIFDNSQSGIEYRVSPITVRDETKVGVRDTMIFSVPS